MFRLSERWFPRVVRRILCCEQPRQTNSQRAKYKLSPEGLSIQGTGQNGKAESRSKKSSNHIGLQSQVRFEREAFDHYLLGAASLAAT